MMVRFENKEIPTLETEKYLLRSLTLEDAPKLFVFMSDAETMKFITPHPVQTLEEMEEKIKNHLANFQKEKEIPWVIIDKNSSEVIGMFCLHKLHMWHRKAELGAILHPGYQRMGFMSEVLKRILPFGFNELALNRIVGDIFAENLGSKRLMEKFWFHKDGILRQKDFDRSRYHDTIVYSLLKVEYDQRSIDLY
ncbi:GNAT family N-acetyltransferase [Neobacillus sp. CF12]|uniref:GNAT family N-acetyltransferase n=1 Tax=Neobacillus sp. CF12 TaxID=3055864 RepID=UPI0025A108BE|nr:GNAT family N-acetyltransferase [Neobacillus sp. CF12]MDM5328506.1 GNAT family N-acetyltransferase [Neobacillus sp. CF12]